MKTSTGGYVNRGFDYPWGSFFFYLYNKYASGNGEAQLVFSVFLGASLVRWLSILLAYALVYSS